MSQKNGKKIPMINMIQMAIPERHNAKSDHEYHVDNTADDVPRHFDRLCGSFSSPSSNTQAHTQNLGPKVPPVVPSHVVTCACRDGWPPGCCPGARETWQAAEILLLRHQLTALLRRQPRRPDLDWADRALLATLLAVIPKARHQGLCLLVTPDTILRWNRDIVRRRWAARPMRGKTGRPESRRNIRALVVRLACENPGWGYRRIHGELPGLGVKIAASTACETLENAGIDPVLRSVPT